MRSDAARIVVAGYVVRGPLGGMAWHHLQYVLGLARLGHDVAFVEDSEDYPACYDAERGEIGVDPSFGLRFAGEAFERLGIGGLWAYHDSHEARWLGPLGKRAEEFCRTADLLINVSGVNPARSWFDAIPARALIDTDPVFTQVRHLRDGHARLRAADHTAFFSFGENIGRESCTVPDDGFPWQPTRQPVVLDAWTPTPGRREAAYTTVMQWESYPAVLLDGRRFGVKATSFEPYLDLARRTTETLELALGSATAPRDLLEEWGWRVRDPYPPTRDPWAFQRYVRSSKGEFSVAKEAYAETGSGWFSERSTGYLASGRPVLLQETGFSDSLETGAGLLTFRSPEEALIGLEEIDSRYESHCRAARELAVEHFDAAEVLTALVNRALTSVSAA